MDTEISIDFKPSRLLMLSYAVIGVISILGIVNMPVAVEFKWAALIAVAAVIAWAMYKYVLLLESSSIIALAYQERLPIGEQWRIKTRQGQGFFGKLVLQDCFVSPYLTVLNLKPTLNQHRWFRQRYAVVILPDAIDNEQYRRLRVLLKWGCRESTEAV